MSLSPSEPHFVSQIYEPPNIGQKWFCIQNIPMDLRFQEKKKGFKYVTSLTIYSNSWDTGEFRCFFKHPVVMLLRFVKVAWLY